MKEQREFENLSIIEIGYMMDYIDMMVNLCEGDGDYRPIDKLLETVLLINNGAAQVIHLRYTGLLHRKGVLTKWEEVRDRVYESCVEKYGKEETKHVFVGLLDED